MSQGRAWQFPVRMVLMVPAWSFKRMQDIARQSKSPQDDFQLCKFLLWSRGFILVIVHPQQCKVDARVPFNSGVRMPRVLQSVQGILPLEQQKYRVFFRGGWFVSHVFVVVLKHLAEKASHFFSLGQLLMTSQQHKFRCILSEGKSNKQFWPAIQKHSKTKQHALGCAQKRYSLLITGSHKYIFGGVPPQKKYTCPCLLISLAGIYL